MPDSKTIRWLQGQRNSTSKSKRSIAPLQELSDEDKDRTHLVTLGTRCEVIQGDPFGILPSWAGNVAHPRDDRIFEVMEPIFESLKELKELDTDEISSIRRFLVATRTLDPKTLAQEMATDGAYVLVKNTADETTVDFDLANHKVRLTQAHDIDNADSKSYNRANRAKEAIQRAVAAFDEPPMTVLLQQYVMACHLKDEQDEAPPGSSSQDEQFYENLRSTAQMKFWLLSSKEERNKCRAESMRPQPLLEDFIDIIKSNWKSSWSGTGQSKDYFYNYAKDQTAAETNAWRLIEADIYVVVDKHKRVVFADIERLTQILFGGQEAAALLEKCLDLWSYFTPLPLPETSRHVVDRYIRHIHPELDIEKATAERLATAKMAVAHLGCWADEYDNLGRRIVRTSDAAFSRSKEQAYCRSLFPQFCEAALGKATALIRFLVQQLDPEYYAECVDILKHLPLDEKIESDEEDFMSLFAFGVNGYTQRHIDSRDVVGGLAGLVTLGHYTGGHLCVPQLGIRVRYSPGSVAIIRGDRLEHFVQDYTPPRFFLIGTNHERNKNYALRKMGRLPALPPRMSRDSQEQQGASFDDSGASIDDPCINQGCDEDDDIPWTNKAIHGPAVLDSESSTETRNTGAADQ